MEHTQYGYRRNDHHPSARLAMKADANNIPREKHPSVDAQRMSSSNAERSLSTAATMEALGIRLRPPGLYSPNPAVYQPPAQRYASTHPTSHPRPYSWAGHGPDILQYYPYTNYQGGYEQLYYPSVTQAGNQMELPDETSNFSSLESNVSVFPYDAPNSVESHHRPVAPNRSEAHSDLLSVDYNFSGIYQTAPLPYQHYLPAPTDELDLPGYPDPGSYSSSEYTPRSSLTLSSTALSPIPSPRFPQSQAELATGLNRPKASPSPRQSKRHAPYTLDVARKRWSTGSYAFTPSRRPSPLAHQKSDESQQAAHSNRFSVPSFSASSTVPSNLFSAPVLGSSPARSHPQSFIRPSNTDSHSRAPPGSVTSFPPAALKTLQSNVEPGGGCFDHYANLSDPPDLLGPLLREPSAPPAADTNPEHPELAPHEQDLRFDNDLYTPRWVRGHGNKREGWCGICKPGRWLVLKNSAFWYDKSFSHGVSASTGRAFEPPGETRRMEGNADIWEGLCGSCGDWIPLVSSKKKGTTWFRHAYKCQSHSKGKETSKKRREVTSSTASSSRKSPLPPSSTACEEPHPHPPLPVTGILGDRSLAGFQTISTLPTLSRMI